MVEVTISFTKQAELLLKEMPNISKEDLIKWQQKKGIELGGGDVVMFLEYKEVKS